MKIVRTVLGASLAMSAGYFAWAFVTADMNWMRGLWTWERGDRFALLHAMATCALLGGMAGAWSRFTSNQ